MRVAVFFSGIFLGTLGAGLSGLGYSDIGTALGLVSCAAMAAAGGVFEAEGSES